MAQSLDDLIVVLLHVHVHVDLAVGEAFLPRFNHFHQRVDAFLNAVLSVHNLLLADVGLQQQHLELPLRNRDGLVLRVELHVVADVVAHLCFDR